MARDRFQRGSGCYTCDRCGRQTRSTGQGEADSGVCAQCFDILGWENTITDCGEDSDEGRVAAKQIARLEAEIKEKTMTKVTAVKPGSETLRQAKLILNEKLDATSTFRKKAAIKAAAAQVAPTLKPEEAQDVIVQRTGATKKQAKKALETVKVEEAFRTNPKYNFEERVTKLMKKGDSREEAEATVSRVIRTKELPQAPTTPGKEVPLEALVHGQHFSTLTKDALAARKMGHDVSNRFGYVVHQGAGSVVVKIVGTAGKEERWAPDMVVVASDKVEDLALLFNANAVSSSGSQSIQTQMEDVMAKAKVAAVKVSAKKAEKTNGKAVVAAPSKTEAAPRVSRLETQTVKLLKTPENGEVKGQALIILETLKGAKNGMTVANLIAKLEGKIATKNVLGLKDVWNMNRPKLLAGKFISIE